jgi:hypothetical protein
MNKLLIALAATLLAIPTLFGSAAEAGGKHGFHRAFHTFLAVQALHSRDRADRETSYRAKRRVKRTIRVAKRPASKPVSVAKVEEPEATETPRQVSQMENSSISTVDGTVATVETGQPEMIAEARDVGCKKFFPSAGMTLSVPCE